MKKLIGITLFIAVGSLIASAQHLVSSKVPAEVKAGLVSAHAQAGASWEREGNE